MALWVPREKTHFDVKGKPKVKPASIVIYKATQYDVCFVLLGACISLVLSPALWHAVNSCAVEAEVLPTVSLGPRAGTFWGGRM